MIALNERQVKALQVGDRVYYKERDGGLSGITFQATVISISKHLITLSCKCRGNNFFPTSYAFIDSKCSNANAKLFKYKNMENNNDSQLDKLPEGTEEVV